MEHQAGAPAAHAHYRRLAVMLGLSFISMYVLMYAMVDRFENVYPNFNQLYMAALMTAPMGVIELLLMKSMCPMRNRNVLILGASVVVGIASWFFIREQTAIGDEQFLKSMIPHHAGAILMCNEASLDATDLQQLCQQIIASQQSEIDQMKAMLTRY
jgi:hypothetical protein